MELKEKIKYIIENDTRLTSKRWVDKLKTVDIENNRSINEFLLFIGHVNFPFSGRRIFNEYLKSWMKKLIVLKSNAEGVI